MNIIIKTIKEILNYGKANGLRPLVFATSCCAVELQQAAFGDYDFGKFTSGTFENNPKHADLLIIAGPVNVKALPQLINIYNQMPKPSYIITLGDCTGKNGPFFGSYSEIQDIASVLPVDICLKGCSPKPEEIIEALKKLQEAIKSKGEAKEKEGQKQELEPVLNKDDDVQSPHTKDFEAIKQ